MKDFKPVSTFFYRKIVGDVLHDGDELHHDDVEDVADHGDFEAHHGGE